MKLRRDYNLLLLFVYCVTTMNSLKRNLCNMKGSYDFYKSIGSPKFISAPMVDQSELAWRQLTRRHNVDICFTQMILAKSYLIAKDYRRLCSDWTDYTHMSGRPEDTELAQSLDKDLIIQIAGSDPNILVQMGRQVQHRASAIDLNLGCPQNTARKGNYGSHLLQDTVLVKKILTQMVNELDCPITAKIRVFDNDDKTIQFCQELEQIGIQMLTAHGRTVHANKLFVGSANWDIIRKIKNAVNIPVIANGGISCYDDALRCMQETGADGVMSSEALLENPKLFSPEKDQLFRTDYVNTQFQTVDEYMDLVQAFPAHQPKIDVVRSHLFKMLYRFVDAPKNSDLRTQLAEGDMEQFRDIINEIKTRLSSVENNTERGIQEGLVGPTTWYMRHRDDRAAARILSTPRVATRLQAKGIQIGSMKPCTSEYDEINGVSSSSSTTTTTTILSKEEEEKLKLQIKLAQLKAKYLEKRQKLETVTTSSNNTTATTNNNNNENNDRNMNFSKFISEKEKSMLQ